jgi:transposase
VDVPAAASSCQDEVVDRDIPSRSGPWSKLSRSDWTLRRTSSRFMGLTVLVRRQLRRGDVLRFFGGLSRCLVGMEACATAHHWARELTKLGHTVRLMPPAYVKPYVKRGKTDIADAEAIAEAVTRPTMRFVAVKTADQEAALMLHKVRDLLVRQRTMLINALRGYLAEFASSPRAGLAA